MVPEHAALSFKLPQPGASSSAATSAGAIVESMTGQTSYHPRMGAYPYPVGAWGYHFPTFPTPTVPSSATPGVAQGDTNVIASGTFPYPYTAVQFSAGQASYVPPIKYPYGAPVLPTSTPAASTSSAEATTDPSASLTQEQEQEQEQEQAYNDLQWKQPYTGPRDPTPAAELQAQDESPDAHELMQAPVTVDSVESSTTTDGDKVAPSTDDPVLSTSSTTGVTA